MDTALAATPAQASATTNSEYGNMPAPVGAAYEAWLAASDEFDRHMAALGEVMPTDRRTYRRQLRELRQAAFKMMHTHGRYAEARVATGCNHYTGGIPVLRVAEMLTTMYDRAARRRQRQFSEEERRRVRLVSYYVRAALAALEPAPNRKK